MHVNSLSNKHLWLAIIWFDLHAILAMQQSLYTKLNPSKQLTENFLKNISNQAVVMEDGRVTIFEVRGQGHERRNFFQQKMPAALNLDFCFIKLVCDYSKFTF